MDAVSDRDFAVELLAAFSLIMVHLSRLAEDLLLFFSREFGFVAIGEEFTTGSSIMPNKQNADALELARGKSARVIGELVRALVMLKGLPSTYNRDLQEDKEGFFDAADTTVRVLRVVAGVVRTLRFREEGIGPRMDNLLLATEVADYLAEKGMPFRQAHHLTGALVRRLLAEGRGFGELSPAEWQALSPLFGEDIASRLDFGRAVERRRVYGGTGSEPLRAQMEEARAALAAMEDWLRGEERLAGYCVGVPPAN
jgi:argininosuccinate lyase